MESRVSCGLRTPCGVHKHKPHVQTKCWFVVVSRWSWQWNRAEAPQVRPTVHSSRNIDLFFTRIERRLTVLERNISASWNWASAPIIVTSNVEAHLNWIDLSNHCLTEYTLLSHFGANLQISEFFASFFKYANIYYFIVLAANDIKAEQIWPESKTWSSRLWTSVLVDCLLSIIVFFSLSKSECIYTLK